MKDSIYNPDKYKILDGNTNHRKSWPEKEKKDYHKLKKEVSRLQIRLFVRIKVQATQKLMIVSLRNVLSVYDFLIKLLLKLL